MATIPYAQTIDPDTGVAVYKWTPMANGDVGQAVTLPHWADRSVQVKGTFGTGGKCRLEGSNDISGTPEFVALNDPQGNALDITAAKIEQVLELAYQMRPNIIAGDGTTALTATMLVRR